MRHSTNNATPIPVVGHTESPTRPHRPRRETPPSSGRGPTWEQLVTMGKAVVVTAAAVWLLAWQFGDLREQIADVKRDVQGIHKRLDRMAE